MASLGGELARAKELAGKAVESDEAGDAKAAAGYYEETAQAMLAAVANGEVTDEEEKQQLEACVQMYKDRVVALRSGEAKTQGASQVEAALAAAKVAGQAQQGVENAGGGKQMAGTAAAGAAAGLFVVGAIGFPITGIVLGAGAAAYAAGIRPKGDTAGDIARGSGKVR